jgi:hypothetical protein
MILKTSQRMAVRVNSITPELPLSDLCGIPDV